MTPISSSASRRAVSSGVSPGSRSPAHASSRYGSASAEQAGPPLPRQDRDIVFAVDHQDDGGMAVIDHLAFDTDACRAIGIGCSATVTTSKLFQPE